MSVPRESSQYMQRRGLPVIFPSVPRMSCLRVLVWRAAVHIRRAARRCSCRVGRDRSRSVFLVR